MIARDLDDAVIPTPCHTVRAVVNGDDVAIVAKTDMKAAIDALEPGLRPVQSVAVHDRVGVGEAEPGIEPAAVEEEQARRRAWAPFDVTEIRTRGQRSIKPQRL